MVGKESGFISAFPVHEAARRGDVEDLQSLLRLGYSVNWTDYDRCTPLHEACSSGKVEAVEFLLDNDAMVRKKDICVGIHKFFATASFNHLRVVGIFPY